jgi:hypothetical protein
LTNYETKQQTTNSHLFKHRLSKSH